MIDDVLRTAWQEDRSEIRVIKDRINAICSYLTGGSFAITAFLLGKDLLPHADWVSRLHLLVDPTFVLLLWVLFLALKKDLTNAHKCKQKREDLIRESLQAPNTYRDPFPDASDEKPKMTENHLYLLPVLGTIAMLSKFGLVCWGLC